MDYTTLGPIAALVTALVGGVCGIVGLVQSWVRGRTDDASQLLADHRSLVDEYRQQHGLDLKRLDALEAQVKSLEKEHAKCQERLKAAEKVLAELPSGPTTGG